MRAMIWAESPEGIIGAGGTIPWRHPGDLKRFKRLTLGATVIMGRRTFESMMGRPLAGRRNLVVTSHSLPLSGPLAGQVAAGGVETAASIEEAIAMAGEADVWFIGGARIYAGAMDHVDLIDVTYVPDRVEGTDVVRAPSIDERVFEASPLVPHEDEPGLWRRTYRRRG